MVRFLASKFRKYWAPKSKLFPWDFKKKIKIAKVILKSHLLKFLTAQNFIIFFIIDAFARKHAQIDKIHRDFVTLSNFLNIPI